MAIRNFIFDFGGVLFDWNPCYFYKDVFGSWEKAEEFIKNICTSEWNSQMDRGRTFDECIKELQAQHPEYAREIGLYKEGWPVMLKGEIPEGVNILQQISRAPQHFNLYGLTNWSAETFHVPQERFPCLKLLKDIVVSGEVKLKKPEKAIFELALQRFGIKAEETLFIDDSKANIEAASSLGIHTVQCTPDYSKVKQEISALTGMQFAPFKAD